eukprot:TRINITY_DN77778_c0_g1_i1.p1 TRINITY_DN77778_c0_g1~~TRINITY_DN77778_c0_g1_i1.p1  ORF type:complete len:237 (-),score=45.08 TRINITY_DN77778_c0_g1_i1:47-757(-)
MSEPVGYPAEPGRSASATSSAQNGEPAELQPQIDQSLQRIEDTLQCLVVQSIRDVNFSVSIADPMLPDIPLISVSEGFCELTGFDRETILGQNCRFLNDGCDIRPALRDGLRLSARTGKHFSGVLNNMKADGTPFLNLLDMRGLSVGKTAAGADRFFIIAVQVDVSERGTDDLPLHHKTQMEHIANLVREELKSAIQRAAIVTATAGDTLGEVTLHPVPKWIPGDVFEQQQEFMGG